MDEKQFKCRKYVLQAYLIDSSYSDHKVISLPYPREDIFFQRNTSESVARLFHSTDNGNQVWIQKKLEPALYIFNCESHEALRRL